MRLDGAYLSGYFSLKGRFSRLELLVAGALLYGIYLGLVELAKLSPEALPPGELLWYRMGICVPWGFALGKRARDLNLSFTYGLIVGLIFPPLGTVFLFQKGAKEKEREAAAASAAASREKEQEPG